jgi:hypothetical protein
MTVSADWKKSLLVGAPDAGIARNVLIAVQLLFERDIELLVRDLHERTITGHLADHLRPQFAGWHIDCEYNWDDHEIKKANGLIVVPDIIVHHRGTPENLLVIEVKKSNTREDDEQDIQKLRAYRDSDLRYQYALFLKVVIGKEAPGIMRSQWI